MMEYFIYNIAYLLRKSGISVSTGEISDCTILLKSFDTDKINNYTFYNLINATMVKKPWGSDYVSWLTLLYFGPDFELATDRTGILAGTSSEENLGQSAGKKVPIELLVEALLKNDIRFIYLYMKDLRLNLRFTIDNRDEALKLFQRESMWDNASDTIRQSYHNGKLSDEDYLASLKIIEKWNNLLKEEIERQLARNMGPETLVLEMKKRNPRTASFIDSDDAMLSKVSQEIQKIGRKMAVRKGIRRSSSSRGAVNLSGTIRHSLKTGTIPLKLIKMQRIPSKPDLWLLCDMSNSVHKFIYFMFMFVYAAQNQYNSIRSFLFVDLLLESTEYLQGQGWATALDKLKNIKGYNLTGYSNYGNVFHQFSSRYLPLLDKKTTVIILGDAKNNSNTGDGHEVLAQIKETAAALYWLNPLDKSLWEKEDCIMNRYLPHCTGGFPCSNIEELEIFLSSLY